MKVKVKILENAKELKLPSKATKHSACVDLCAAVKESVVIDPGNVKLIPIGFVMEIPQGYEAQIRPRSGLALKNCIGLLNSPGTIDSDYRGEVGIILFNFGKEPFTVKHGDRIAQMALVKVEEIEFIEADELSSTQRDTGGFGHTGL